MKLNNRGFAITTIMYIILMFAVIVIALTLALLSSRKLILDKIKSEVALGINGEEEVENIEEYICTLVSDADNSYSITEGDKYQCKVDPNKDPYTFYVLSDGLNGTTNLIMDRNICEDGTPTDPDKTDKCLVAWNSSSLNSGGPVTAMNYLNDATSTWTNLENLNITYNDEGGHFTNFPITGKARLPYKSEVSDYDGTNGYLYEYMDEESGISSGDKSISGIYGYWTFSSNAVYSNLAWLVDCDGGMGYYDVDYERNFGVRPVINLKL